MAIIEDLRSNAASDPWAIIIESYEKSNLTQQRFCEENNIDPKDFKNNRNQLAYNKKKGSVKKTGFAEIKIQEAPLKLLKITHPNGIECSMPPSLSDKEVITLKRTACMLIPEDIKIYLRLEPTDLATLTRTNKLQ